MILMTVLSANEYLIVYKWTIVMVKSPYLSNRFADCTWKSRGVFISISVAIYQKKGSVI